jgi:hypothetical protein
MTDRVEEARQKIRGMLTEIGTASASPLFQTIFDVIADLTDEERAELVAAGPLNPMSKQ